MVTENLSTLKIHKLSQSQYDRELANGTIDEAAIYLTPEEEYYTEAEIDAKISEINSSIENVEVNKADASHIHDAAEITSGILSIERLPLETLNIPKIASGVATGSETASEDNPNQITFPFTPKLVIVTRENRDPSGGTASHESSMMYQWFFWINGVESDKIMLKPSAYYGNNEYFCRHYSLNGNTFSWWVDQGEDQYTTPSAATIGPYIAFG